MRDFLSRLGTSPEESSGEPMDIDSHDDPLDYGLDEVFRFNQGFDIADETEKVDPLTAMNKAMVLWSWRRILSVQTLVECIDADDHTAQLLATSFSMRGLRFRPWLIENAQNYFFRVQTLIQESRKPQLNWVHCLSKRESEIDKIVMAYLHFITISFYFDPDYVDMYFEVCRAVLSSGEEQDVSKPDEDLLAAEVAFRQENHGDKDATGQVLELVRSYYDAYNSEDYIAPYTALVGPSGIGKSYTVQELARKGLYVVYTSLAGKNSGAYPRRSKIADIVEKFRDAEREQATIFFECFIAANLANVELCIKHGISAVGFFESQVGFKFFGFQNAIARYIKKMYDEADAAKSHHRERSDDVEGFDYQQYLSKPLQKYRTDANKLFSALVKHMRSHAQMTAFLQPTTIPQHPIIICIDEARSLFREPRQDNGCEGQFLALRRALRSQSTLSKDEDQKRFFALLLDASSKISDFTAPRSRDPSLNKKNVEGKDLFPPIYQVDSIDILSESTDNGWKELNEAIRTNKSHLTYLYTLGRPLWAARLRAIEKQKRDNSAEWYIRAFATSKVMTVPEANTKGLLEIRHLALFSYRINFNVVPVYDIAEELTSNYMRYIYGVDESRVFVQTHQPSEPILALTSQEQMTESSSTRAEVVKAFYINIMKSTINLGDLGEIAAALVLLFAFDKAEQSGRPRPIKVSTFLSTLFSNDIAIAIRERAMDRDGLRAIWEEGVVFFNHFFRLDIDPDEYVLRMAFYRGCAIFPRAGYKGCDIIIPVFLPNKNKMTYILVQVKNRAQDTSITDGLGNLAKDLLKSAANELHSEATTNPSPPPPPSTKKTKSQRRKKSKKAKTTPHLGIMMCLRGQWDEASAEVVYPHPAHEKSSEPGKFNFNDHERIIVAAVGMDFNVYPGLLHPRDSLTYPGPSAEVIAFLKRLLSCTADGHMGGMSDYHKNLRLIRFFSRGHVQGVSG